LQTPGDFQELKFRTMTSKTAAESFRAYGAEPVQAPYAEVYSDLQLHRIHGQSNPVFAIEEMGFHDVQSHMTLPKASRFVSSLIANPEWFAGLTERERQWLTGAVEDLSGLAWDIAQQLNQERLDTMVERGDIKLVTLSDQERAAFRKASQEARTEFIKATDEKGQTLLSLMENGRQAP
jgi:TRAP-type C4-dicarboxylate transport system substrate-binding protein